MGKEQLVVNPSLRDCVQLGLRKAESTQGQSTAIHRFCIWFAVGASHVANTGSVADLVASCCNCHVPLNAVLLRINPVCESENICYTFAACQTKHCLDSGIQCSTKYPAILLPSQRAWTSTGDRYL